MTKRPATKTPADKTLKPGDTVTWRSSQGEIKGKVVRKATSPTRIKTHKVAASVDDPQFIVQSDKTGATAAHKADRLKRSH